MNNWIERGEKSIMKTYSQFPLVYEEGNGVIVRDIEGKEYLDFVSGIAVNCLGYNNKKYNNAVIDQLNKFNHCSNLYWNKTSIEVAELLTNNSDLDKVFFCNSGAEAIEAAIKLARKYAKKYKDENAVEIITMDQSFHGRTIAAITATGQTKYQKGLSPLLPGIKYAKFNSFKSVKNLVTENTCAIIIEPIQGEGGIIPADKDFLAKVRELCDSENIVLIYDEVQCGIGRTGELFAYQYYGINPDIVTLAKGLGGGLPIGSMLSKDKIAKGFEPGDHASTFGGNPVVCSGSKIVLEELLNNGLLNHVKEVGLYLSEKLQELKQKHSNIIDVRGFGLMQGIEVNQAPSDIVKKCMNKGLLLVGAGKNVIRFVPPLIISKEEIDKGINILDEVL